MKTAGLLAIALLSTGATARAAEEPVAKPALSARLENPKMAEDAKSLTVDFILTNQSEKPVVFAERWNSWGADQWSLTLHRKDGDPVKFTNPQRVWTKNYLTVVTLELGKEHRSHCLLTLAEPLPRTKDQDAFTPAKDAKLQDLKMTSGLSGVFSVTEIHKETHPTKELSTNWTGEVTAEKIEIPGK